MLEEFTVQLHHEEPHGERTALSRLSLLYVIKRVVGNLEARVDLPRAALETAVADAFTRAFAPEPIRLAEDDVQEPSLPFPLGGITPGLHLTLDEEGEPLRMQAITQEQSEAVRTHLNQALQVVADDPAEFDSPLLLGPEDSQHNTQ